MESPFSTLGLLQEAQARGRYHNDWERDYCSLREESDRNERSRAIWAAFERIVLFVLRPVSTLRAAHVLAALDRSRLSQRAGPVDLLSDRAAR
jgi:hypothetical protein